MADSKGWVSDPNGRGTMKIIYNCLSTIVICTWSALHMNLPADTDSWTKRTLRQLLWMGLAILAPELIAIHALRERYETRWHFHQTVSIVKRCVEKGRASLSSTSSSLNRTLSGEPKQIDTPLAGHKEGHGEKSNGKLASMSSSSDGERPGSVEDTVKPPSSEIEQCCPEEGDLALPSVPSSSDNKHLEKIEEIVTPAPSETPPETVDTEATTKWTLTHAQYVLMGGFNAVPLDGKPYKLNPLEFLALLELGKIDLPEVDEEDIKDKSKIDSLSKALACLQITWFVICIISRTAQHLPVATLELFTLGVVCCTFFDYWGWWRKLKDICRANVILIDMSREELEGLLDSEEFSDGYSSRGVRISMTDNIGREKTKMKLYMLTWALPTLAFGSCHLLAWNAHFASAIEMTLWKVSSIGCFVLPLGFLILGDVARRYELPFDTGLFIAGVLYGVCRLYLFVEMFAGLRDSPAAVYDDVNWLQFWPHFGS